MSDFSEVFFYSLNNCHKNDWLTYILSFFLFLKWIIWVFANTLSFISSDFSIWLIINIYTSLIWFVLWVISKEINLDRPDFGSNCDTTPGFPAANFVSLVGLFMHFIVMIYFYGFKLGVIKMTLIWVAIIGYCAATFWNEYLYLWQWVVALIMSVVAVSIVFFFYHFIIIRELDYICSTPIFKYFGLRNCLFEDYWNTKVVHELDECGSKTCIENYENKKTKQTDRSFWHL
jgi:hypothetical protein